MKRLLVRNALLEGRKHDFLIVGNKFARVARNVVYPGVAVLDARRMVALPPLYNAHTHAAMTLLRGYADDMRLKEWLETKIWPLEARMTERDVYIGTRLACLEMIKSGTVFFNDMYWHIRGTRRAVVESGMRAALSPVFIDAGVPDKGAAARRETERLVEECDRGRMRVAPALGPHAVYTVSDDNLRWIADFGRKHSLPIHIHMSETAYEVSQCVKRTGRRPFEHLENIGFLEGNNVFAAHCVYVSESEIAIMARRDVKVAHIPVSNMKLAVGGIMHHAAMRDAGITVLLGTDGCSSNNCLDMFQTMKFAALLQKHDTNDPTRFPAAEAWECATSLAAGAFGTGAGAIVTGKAADFMLVDVNRPELTPGHNLYSDLVYAANGNCVDTLVCGGRVLMQGRKVADEDEIVKEARRAAARLARGSQERRDRVSRAGKCIRERVGTKCATKWSD